MAINWAPNEAEEVLQNVQTLIATEPGTVPMSRDMGMPQNAVDAPISTASALLQAAAIKAVRTYEPRAAIKAMKVSGDADGKLTVTPTLGTP